MAKSVSEGACTLAYCAVGDVTPGAFYTRPGVVQQVQGSDVQKELWDASVQMVTSVKNK